MSSFDIPGDPNFPLNAFMTKPASRGEAGRTGERERERERERGRGRERGRDIGGTCRERAHLWRCIVFFSQDQMRQYFTQMRQELGQRLVERVFGDGDKPSKVGRERERVCSQRPNFMCRIILLIFVANNH